MSGHRGTYTSKTKRAKERRDRMADLEQLIVLLACQLYTHTALMALSNSTLREETSRQQLRLTRAVAEYEALKSQLD